jgi:hypothetical protein
MNTDKEEYSEKRLTDDDLFAVRKKPVQEIINVIMDKVKLHADTEPQSDDISS